MTGRGDREAAMVALFTASGESRLTRIPWEEAWFRRHHLSSFLASCGG